MAYDEKLANRIWAELGQQNGLSEKKNVRRVSLFAQWQHVLWRARRRDDYPLAPNQTEDALSKQHTRIVLLASLIGLVTTFTWWRNADQSK